MKKIKCFLGWHTYQWKLRDFPNSLAKNEIPKGVKCKYCKK